MEASPEGKSKGCCISNNSLLPVCILVAVASFFAGLYIDSLYNDLVLDQKLNEIKDMIRNIEIPVQASPIVDDTSDIRIETSPTVPPAPPVKISVDDDPVLGDPNAKLTLIEFSDFQCPFCQRFHAETLPLIKANYIDTGIVKLVYRDFPLQSIHPNALPAAVAAECAEDQGIFWEYHDTLFQRMNEWGPRSAADAQQTFNAFAEELGLDIEQFVQCFDSGEYVTEVANDFTDGAEYGVTGTPAFFLGNDEIGYTMITGAQPYQSFQGFIESMLEQ